VADPTPAPTGDRSAAAPLYLTEAKPDLASWLRFFNQIELPVLAATARAIEDLRAIEDDVDAGMLSRVIDTDPLMTLKLLIDISQRRKDEDTTEIETVTTSLVMYGVAPFFRRFASFCTLEDQLRDQPEALHGALSLLQRARRAAHYALAFAVHRGDTDAVVIQEAAFLHDFVNLLMWCYAPTLQLDVRAKQKADANLRSAPLQRFVFNVDFNDLRQALMKLWRLPSLLVRISDGKHAEHPAVRNVVLAVRLARHSQYGWDNAAIPDDVNDIALLLNAAPRVVQSYLRKLDPDLQVEAPPAP
jgi:HD-like signal output (HDOD) protein